MAFQFSFPEYCEETNVFHRGGFLLRKIPLIGKHQMKTGHDHCILVLHLSPPSTRLLCTFLLHFCCHLNFSLLNFSLTPVQEVNETFLVSPKLGSLRIETDL